MESIAAPPTAHVFPMLSVAPVMVIVEDGTTAVIARKFPTVPAESAPEPERVMVEAPEVPVKSELELIVALRDPDADNVPHEAPEHPAPVSPRVTPPDAESLKTVGVKFWFAEVWTVAVTGWRSTRTTFGVEPEEKEDVTPAHPEELMFHVGVRVAFAVGSACAPPFELFARMSKMKGEETEFACPVPMEDTTSPPAAVFTVGPTADVVARVDPPHCASTRGVAEMLLASRMTTAIPPTGDGSATVTVCTPGVAPAE